MVGGVSSGSDSQGISISGAGGVCGVCGVCGISISGCGIVIVTQLRITGSVQIWGLAARSCCTFFPKRAATFSSVSHRRIVYFITFLLNNLLYEKPLLFQSMHARGFCPRNKKEGITPSFYTSYVGSSCFSSRKVSISIMSSKVHSRTIILYSST